MNLGHPSLRPPTGGRLGYTRRRPAEDPSHGHPAAGHGAGGGGLLLESHPRLTVIGEASNRMEALAVATREQPDVILLDADSGVEISLEILPELFAAVRPKLAWSR
jgi:hypothetical protein